MLGYLANPRALLLIPLLLVLIAAVACGEDATATPRPTATALPTATTVPPTPTPTAVPTPTPAFFTSSVGQLITGTPPALHDTPIPWQTTSVLFLTRPPFENLMTVDIDNPGIYIPQLASSWEMAPDGKAWTVQLLEDIPFHFGWDEFTSRDVLHTFIKVSEDSSRATDRNRWLKWVGSSDNVELQGDHQVTFNLTGINPDLDWLMSGRSGNLVLTSKAQWDAEGEPGMLKQPAGTGPWQFVERRIGEFALYERVEDHWRIVPEFKELKMRMIPEDASRMAAALAEEIHMAELPKDLQEDLIAQKGWKRVSAEAPGQAWFYLWGGLYFSTPDKFDPDLPVVNKLVRQAMNKAIDREEMIDTLLRGRAKIATHQLYHPTRQAWDPSWAQRFDEFYGYDPDKAKQLLADAGYPEGFDISIYSYPYGGWPEILQINEALAQYWTAIGIDVKIEDVDYALGRQAGRGKTLGGHIMGFPPFGSRPPHIQVASLFWSQGGFVIYETPEIDTLYESLAGIADPADRERIQKEIGEILFTEFSHIPLFFTFYEVLVDPTMVAEYRTPGTYTDGLYALETVKAAR